MSHFYDCDPSDLDEFLVEYVDGTMDPVVREAFEEFLRMYPEVQAQVDCLSSIRTKLCRLGADCRCQAPPGFQDRLRRQLAGEMTETVTLEHWTPQLNMIALAFSLAILAFAVGLSRVGDESALAKGPVADSESIELVSNGQEALRDRPAPATDDLTRPSPSLDHWARGSASLPHQVSAPSALATVFDQPVLMSVRRDLVAMRPMAMSSVAP